jgi:hypothetical protein
MRHVSLFLFSFIKIKKKLLQNNSRDSKKVLDRFILYYLHRFQIKFRIVITSINFSLNWRNISYSWIYIYIYIERERERERENGFFTDRPIVPHLVGHKNIYDFINLILAINEFQLLTILFVV